MVEKNYVRVSKIKAKKYAQKEFNVPINVEGAIMNQFTGQEIVLVSTKSSPKKWHIVHLGQDADQEFGTDENSAKKEFAKWWK